MGMMGILVWACLAAPAAEVSGNYPFSPVPFTSVRFADEFWAKRLETNRTVTLPYDFKKCEETGRIDNFAKAGGLMPGKHQGIFFDDSDVFKIVEGAASSLALHPDAELDAYVDALIAKFAAAQEDDGYLYTARTIDPANPPKGSGPERWSNLRESHELYNVGHMYEAAAAHYWATGKRNFLEVALKNADLLVNTFGPDKLVLVPGHEEIEMGLVKLFRITQERKYLDLAKFFIDMRGRADKRELWGEYLQDDAPIVEQSEARGHAVRAGYLYSGMADVAALTGEAAYVEALGRIWENMVGKKLYLTGGLGARREGESFGANYELPAATAYNETCAALAGCLFNHRMFLLHGDAKYMDVFERILYNGFLVGISMEGNTFFYPNPLETDGKTEFNHGSALRQPWFGCSCCPSNVVRFLPALPGCVYAQRGQELYVNLYAAGTAKVEMPGGAVEVTQETRYPWDGDIALRLRMAQPAEFTLYLRVPGLAQGHPVPGDLYRYTDSAGNAPTIEVNGVAAPLELERGYARLRQTWKDGDTIRLRLPMPVRRVVAHESVEDCRGKVALERGPIVFCAEGVDNDGRVLGLALSDAAEFSAEFRPELLGGVMTLQGEAVGATGAGKSRPFQAIPYYAWAHRGAGEMTVWFARKTK